MNITLYSDIEVEADKTIRKWQSLVKDEPLVCMYMGNLPDKELYKEGIIFYYLEQIKTNKGSWKIPE